uniref:Uncharacterized protein n=1 Tax=Glossina palpalis gambiensis TaxID=67801 RepID=A0A1B0B3R9_9MUSC
MEIFGKFSATLQLISQITRRLTYSFCSRPAVSLERTHKCRSRFEELSSQDLCTENKLKSDKQTVFVNPLADSRLKLSNLTTDLPTIAVVDITTLGAPGQINRFLITVNDRKSSGVIKNETRTNTTLDNNTGLIPWYETNIDAIAQFAESNKDIKCLSTENQLLKLVDLVQPATEIKKNIEFPKKTQNALMLYVKPQIYSPTFEPHGRSYSTRTFTKKTAESNRVVAEGREKKFASPQLAFGRSVKASEKEITESSKKDTPENDIPMFRKINDVKKDLHMRSAAAKSNEEIICKSVEKSISKTNLLHSKEMLQELAELIRKKQTGKQKIKRNSIVTYFKPSPAGKNIVYKASTRPKPVTRFRNAILAKDKCPQDPCKDEKTCPDPCAEELAKIKHNRKVDEHMAKKKRKKMPESCVNEKCKRKGGCLPPPKKQADSSGKLISILANAPARNSMRVAGVSMKAWPRFNPKSAAKSKNKLNRLSSPNAMLAIKGKKDGKTKLQFTILF